MNSKDLQNILDSFIEVNIDPDKFLIVKETLTRLGVSPRNKKVLYQSCHLLAMNGKNYITHFKELFLLDGKESTLDETDCHRRNQIAKLLQDWNLLKIVNPSRFPVEDYYIKMLKIVSASDKVNWNLVPKYHLGSFNPDHKPYNASLSSSSNKKEEVKEVNGNIDPFWKNKGII